MTRFDYHSKDFDSNNDLVEAWRKLRGEYVVQFYRELRQAIPKDKTIYTGLPRGRYLGPPYGNLYLDWESLIKEKLVDGIVLHVTSTMLHTPLYVPHRQIGYLSSEMTTSTCRQSSNASTTSTGLSKRTPTV